MTLRFCNKFSIMLAISLLLPNLISAAEPKIFQKKMVGKSGFFIGASGGMNVVTPNYGDSSYTVTYVTTKTDTAIFQLGNLSGDNEFGWAAGAKVGYKAFIGQRWGINTYVDYYYSRSTGTKRGNGSAPPRDYPIRAEYHTKRETHFGSVNVDVFYNRDRLGGFIGAGIGVQGYNFDSTITTRYVGSWPNVETAKYTKTTEINEPYKSALSIPLNLGITYDLSASNQVYVSARIPLFSYHYTYSSKGFAGGLTLKNYLLQIGYIVTF